LSDNNLFGSVPSFIGDIVLTDIRLSNNGFTSLPDIREDHPYDRIRLYDNKLSGTLSDSFKNLTIKDIYLEFNLDLITPSSKPSNWTNYTNYQTASSPEYDLNRTSTTVKYAIALPQDSGFILLNQDREGDGHADLNLTLNNSTIPEYNIDVNGDGKADLNIIISPYSIGRSGSLVVYNQAKAITTTSDGFLGWIRPDRDYVAGMTKADFEVSSEYPYYVIAKTSGALIPTTDTPPLILELNKKVNEIVLNQDTNADGIPDVNIDINGDNIPDFNVNIPAPTPTLTPS
jgi:hypothetical protein